MTALIALMLARAAGALVRRSSEPFEQQRDEGAELTQDVWGLGGAQGRCARVSEPLNNG